jgi:hypothetical protein
MNNLDFNCLPATSGRVIYLGGASLSDDDKKSLRCKNKGREVLFVEDFDMKESKAGDMIIGSPSRDRPLFLYKQDEEEAKRLFMNNNLPY